MKGLCPHSNTALRGLLCGALTCLPLIASAGNDEPLSPKAILQQIEQHGARSVIGHSEEEWGELVIRMQRGIEAGQPEWAEVARQLGPSTDAGSATDLRIVVSRALPKSPRLVLSITGSLPLVLEDVCGSIPFDKEDDLEIKKRHLLAAEDALSKLKIPDDPRLEEKRKDCLHEVQAAKCYIFDCSQLGRDKNSIRR